MCIDESGEYEKKETDTCGQREREHKRVRELQCGTAGLCIRIHAHAEQKNNDRKKAWLPIGETEVEVQRGGGRAGAQRIHHHQPPPADNAEEA